MAYSLAVSNKTYLKTFKDCSVCIGASKTHELGLPFRVIDGICEGISNSPNKGEDLAGFIVRAGGYQEKYPSSQDKEKQNYDEIHCVLLNALQRLFTGERYAGAARLVSAKRGIEGSGILPDENSGDYPGLIVKLSEEVMEECLEELLKKGITPKYYPLQDRTALGKLKACYTNENEIVAGLARDLNENAAGCLFKVLTFLCR